MYDTKAVASTSSKLTFGLKIIFSSFSAMPSPKNERRIPDRKAGDIQEHTEPESNDNGPMDSFAKRRLSGEISEDAQSFLVDGRHG
jgi:hypothetical protein